MPSEDILEKRRRHDVAIDVPEQHSSDRRSLQMVGRLAAAVVHDDGLSQQARHQDRRKGSQQERPIRRRKDVNDVGLLKPFRQQGPIGQLRHERPDIADIECSPKRRRRNRVDRNQPRLDVGVGLPGVDQARRLHCLAAQDAHRRGDERDFQRSLEHNGHYKSFVTVTKTSSTALSVQSVRLR